MARLTEARRQRCLVIQGPAGSGKASTLDFDVAWLSLAPEDNNLACFFNGMVASLATVDEAIVHDAWLLMGRDGDQSAVEHCVITLVRAIAARKRELMLMLDDVHHLDDPASCLPCAGCWTTHRRNSKWCSGSKPRARAVMASSVT
ncbi:ATP-binding protein [Cupriavidus sp. IDO]|uniref:ATP-binding protein n=1 Tax=Cupriavidus sp. IDO TaxID=1539142 RepID=UPI0030832629